MHRSAPAVVAREPPYSERMPPQTVFGSHLSIAGHLCNALDEAATLGLDTVQVFTKNQRQWKVKPLDESVADEWCARAADLGFGEHLVAHDSYLINLASPDDELWEKSIALMREEIDRCERLGIGRLVSHPGAHMRRDEEPSQAEEAGLVRIARAYKRLLRATRGYGVMMCFENTAGGGTTLGRTFEELARLAELVHEEAGADAEGRVGFCFDTCHALAAGYDLAAREDADKPSTKRTIAAGRELADAVLEEFDRVCGLDRLGVVHVNDSKAARGSRRDLHEHIGKGHVGKGALAAVLNHPKLRGVPMILETPKGENEKGRAWDAMNLAQLRRLLR